MRNLLPLLTASAALVLTACGGAKPEVRNAPPAVAPLPSPVVEYRPGPIEAVPVSTSALVLISSVPVSAFAASAPIVVADLPAMNPVPHEPPAALSADVNVVVLVSEAVGDPAQDLGSYTKVFVDNQLLGQTEKAAKSTQKRWGASLAPGNHLFRFEKWDLPRVGDWTMLDSQWQAPERFVRVDAQSRAVIRLKFYDEGRGHSLQIDRTPLPAPLP